MKQNRNVVYDCKFHVVWCPKYRRKVLKDQIEERLAVLIRETVEKYKSELIALEIMPDHVHLLVGVDPQFGIHRLVKNIKGRTSRYLREEFPKLKTQMPSLWTNSYFVSPLVGHLFLLLNNTSRHRKKSEKILPIQS